VSEIPIGEAMKTFLKQLFAKKNFIQIYLIEVDFLGETVYPFQFRIEDNPTLREMENVSKVAMRRLRDGVSMPYSEMKFVVVGKTSDSMMGQIPDYTPHPDSPPYSYPIVYPVTQIELT
jgi:hypothetical protein